MNSAQAAFLEYHKQNPHVYREYRRFAMQLHAAGVSRKSISMITERIRWNTTTRGQGDFKINNTLRAGYSRLLIWNNPEFQYPGCFTLKSSKIDGVFGADFRDFRTWDSEYWNLFATGKM